MNRREWMKLNSLLSGEIILVPGQLIPVQAKGDNSKSTTIEEIHIINLSHTDFGYTDLPSSTWDFHVKNIRLAMDYCEETIQYPEEARFKWTFESFWILERFLQEAAPDEIQRFDKLVDAGLIEITVMPGNMTCLLGSHEWEKELDRLSPVYQKYNPKIAIQDDVTGLPLGLVNSLSKRGIKHLVTGANTYYTGGVPLPAPSFFWWKNNKGEKILAYNGEPYHSAYDYFHKTPWRKGPVPHRYDIWFNQPEGNEIFSSKEEDILKSYEILKSKLKDISQRYPFSALQLSMTNHLTMDNDYPCRQLSEFVKSWNEMKLQPQLVFSTPSRFFERISQEITQEVKTLHGEWCDWWADGITASPFEVSILQSAKRRNVDIDNALKLLKIDSNIFKKRINQLNHDLVFASEHTWGAYDSVARPYAERTKGNIAQKFDYFYQADENSKRIRADVIRASDRYKPFSRTKFIEVLNPGKEERSGWASISARAFRFKANAAKDTRSGAIHLFEEILDSEWSERDDTIVTPNAIPNDVWPYHPVEYRFFLEKLKPGEHRKFELVQIDDLDTKPKKANQFFELEIDKQNKVIRNIIYKPLNTKLFDDDSSYLPGQLIIERPQGEYSRAKIADGTISPGDMKQDSPVITESLKVDNECATRYKYVLNEKFAKRIEQQWDIFKTIPCIEITTTIWMKENLDPIAAYQAFPFAVKSPKAYYDSLGATIQVGVDQIPNTCGEYSTVQNGVWFEGDNINLALTTLDTPMGIFDSIERGSKRGVFKPKSGHFYSMIFQNYWLTNFATLQPTKLVIRQIIECGDPEAPISPVENNEIWAYPSI